MLKLCGLGVAMGNTIEKVKNKADIVIRTNDEDGITYFLENLDGIV
jgi:hydroxymethylpyrimidine pyrophosphatase-like HAD family hydrolase